MIAKLFGEGRIPLTSNLKCSTCYHIGGFPRLFSHPLL